jgi:hypothetical protein
MNKAYTTIEEVENYTLQDIVDSFEPQVENWITSVSYLMDTLANRVLVAPALGSGEYEIQYYDGDGSNWLLIDDCQELAKLSIGDQWGDNLIDINPSEYAIKPKTPPISQIILKGDKFPTGVQNVEIQGNFGLFRELPPDLKFACTVIVAGIINYQTKGGDNKSSESIGSYSVSYTDEQGISDYANALQIINSYRKLNF